VGVVAGAAFVAGAPHAERAASPRDSVKVEVESFSEMPYLHGWDVKLYARLLVHAPGDIRSPYSVGVGLNESRGMESSGLMMVNGSVVTTVRAKTFDQAVGFLVSDAADYFKPRV